MSSSHLLKRFLKEFTVSLLMRVVALLPLSLLYFLGDGVGRLIIFWPNKQRRNALLNIALCLPILNPQEQRALRDQTLKEFGKTYLEIAYLWLRPLKQVLSLIQEVVGVELLQRNEGQGLIVLSPHLGAWELAGLYLALQRPTAIFYKPQKYLDKFIRTARARTGAELAPINRHGIRILVDALEHGHAVGILPDQEPRSGHGAVFAPLFGIPALTMLLIKRLARRTHAPVVFLFAERLPAGKGFRMHCRPAPADIDHENNWIAAAALNRGIEDCVLTCPEQYLWPYKRFRRRPDGALKIYTGGLTDYNVLQQVKLIQKSLI